MPVCPGALIWQCGELFRRASLILEVGILSESLPYQTEVASVSSISVPLLVTFRC